MYHVGEEIYAIDVEDFQGNICLSGSTALCCPADVGEGILSGCVRSGESRDQFVFDDTEPSMTGCSSDASSSCPSNAPTFVASGILDQSQNLCGNQQSSGFCCPKPLPFTNCEWHGTPPLCTDDNVCGIGQVQIRTYFQRMP